MGPLTSLLECKQADQLTAEAAADTAQLALRFLENAHTNIATERRKHVISHLNKELRPIVEEANRFDAAVPTARLHVGAAPPEEAADTAEEAATAHTMRRSTAQQKMGTGNRIKYTRDYVPQLLVMSLLNKEKCCTLTHSCAAQALQSKQVSDIVTKLATLNLPLAGRLSYLLSNCEVIMGITNGNRLQGTIPARKPWQNHRPPQITFKEGEEDKQAISETRNSPQGFYPQMFVVPKKDGRQKTVINLKRSVETKHFKMEGNHMLKDLLKAGDWMAKIDLKEAYFMIPIAQEEREFLQWKDKAYQFNCLPFGLSLAPWFFTKTTRPLVAALRELGLHLIIYIDNILVVAVTESPLRDHITAVIYLLENLTPTQEIPSSTDMELKLPGQKMRKIRSKAFQSLSVSALMLSCMIGEMNATSQAIPMAPLYYRNLQACLQEAVQEDQGYS